MDAGEEILRSIKVGPDNRIRKATVQCIYVPQSAPKVNPQPHPFNQRNLLKPFFISFFIKHQIHNRESPSTVKLMLSFPPLLLPPALPPPPPPPLPLTPTLLPLLALLFSVASFAAAPRLPVSAANLRAATSFVGESEEGADGEPPLG